MYSSNRTQGFKINSNVLLVPSAPQNLEVIQYNATAYRVSWLPPEHPNGQIFGYYVYQDKLTDGVPIANGRKKAAMLMDKSVNIFNTQLKMLTECSR